MSITVQSSPPLVAITGNPVLFKLSTDNQFEIAGSKTNAQVTFFDVGVDGDSFTIEWGNNSITFTCKDSPDDSGLQIPTVPTNIANWVAVVAQVVSLHYSIFDAFQVTASGPDLRLVARENGAGTIVALSSSWTGSAPSLIQTDGIDDVARTFFKIGLQVLIKSGESFVKIGEDLLPVDSNGEAIFNIRRLFADQLESDFKFPDASDELLIERPNMCREYRIRYYEQYGPDLTPQKVLESQSYWILKAGISHLQQAIYNRQGSSLWDKITYNNYFQTWQPKEKYSDRWQTEKLYFLVQNTLTELRLVVEVNYNDSNPQAVITKETVVDPTEKGVYEIAITLNTLQLPGYDQENIDYYRVWMADSGGFRISEIRTFRMDYRNFEYVRAFLFLNSMGGWDTLRTTGDVSDSLDLKRVEISKVLGSDFTERNHQVENAVTREIKRYTANTGWKTEADVSWIRDFLLSPQIYQISNVNKLIPIIITTTDALQRKDREDLFSINFEYRRAFSNEFYSKQIVYSDFNDDFNDDFTNE